MQVKIKDLRYVMAEKYEFTSNNENEKGKIISGYFLTFVTVMDEKLVISSGDKYEKLTGKWVDVDVDLAYREFQGKKGWKLKVDNLTETKKPDFASE